MNRKHIFKKYVKIFFILGIMHIFYFVCWLRIYRCNKGENPGELISPSGWLRTLTNRLRKLASSKLSRALALSFRGKSPKSMGFYLPLIPPFPLPPRNGHCVVLVCVRICFANSYDLIGWKHIINYKNWCFLNLEFLKSQTRYAQTVRFLYEILQFENIAIFPPL